MTSLAYLVILLLAAAPAAWAVYVRLDATTLTPALMKSSCVGQGDRNVCNPLNRPETYITCSGREPKEARCRGGQLFDYVERKCVSADTAKTCPFWKCPAPAESPALGPSQGEFGQPGDITISLDQQDFFTVFSPIDGQCLGGMTFDITVDCPAPADRPSRTFTVDFLQTVGNSQVYPQRLEDIGAFCGDKVQVTWQAPIHVVSTFNTSAAAKPMWQAMWVSPLVPQPVYKCPTWQTVAATGAPIPRAGDEVILAPQYGPAGTTWTATMPETFFFVGPVANHCRLGQVFRVSVLPTPLDPLYAPNQYYVDFSISSNNLRDLDIYVGDAIHFSWGVNKFHAIYKVSGLEAY